MDMPPVSYRRAAGFIAAVIAAYFLVDAFLGRMHVAWQVMAFLTIVCGILVGFIATSGINERD